MNTIWVVCIMIVMIIITYLFNIEKDNMIKKIFLFLFISCFVLLGNFFVNATDYGKWLSATVPWWWTFTLQDYWNFLTDYEYKYFITNENTFYYSVSWINKKLYVLASSYDNIHSPATQGFITDFWLCPINQSLCAPTLGEISADDFYNSSIYNNPDFISIDYLYSNVSFCFWYEILDKKVCAYFSPYISDYITWNLNISSIPLPENFVGSQLSSYVWNSPFSNSSNNWPISYTWTFEDEIDSTIAYYEYRYNWNENMCYVWTNDLEHSFRYFIWQWVPYEFWSGATLYQLYYSIYSWFGNNKIRNLWSFINSWVINYWMVYDTLWEDDIRYVARYNWPDTNVTILYTWYTNELFLGNLGAIYNMASVLYNSYMKESTMWEEVAYYCDIKLNYQNYKNWSLSFTWLQDLVTPWIIERVGDYISRDMPWSTWYIQPDMWSWSIWNDIVSSWYAIPEDINPTNLFKDYYEKMNNLVRNFVPASWTWIIPDWILFPMLFLIFYRIIRH